MRYEEGEPRAWCVCGCLVDLQAMCTPSHLLVPLGDTSRQDDRFFVQIMSCSGGVCVSNRVSTWYLVKELGGAADFCMVQFFFKKKHRRRVMEQTTNTLGLKCPKRHQPPPPRTPLQHCAFASNLDKTMHALPDAHLWGAGRPLRRAQRLALCSILFVLVVEKQRRN